MVLTPRIAAVISGLQWLVSLTAVVFAGLAVLVALPMDSGRRAFAERIFKAALATVPRSRGGYSEKT
ncbi:hypothetical protein [Amycolatopsis sp. lyj-346]|uniref:hypothetical protein n=1 Tax=Amycolatopsis sp. lyj-346 TaxID=2789289 RepID=UPI00397BB9B3